jgi:putative SOS response-associated peptidase YedK
MGEHRTMRGRYDLSENPDRIAAQFYVPLVPDYEPSDDMRPTQALPIIRQIYASDAQAADPLAREGVLARWGLVPPWAKDTRFGLRCVNARAETVDRLPAFRVAYRHRRCLVPINAFFEWSGEPEHPIRWRISQADGRVFALGGLWERWIDRLTQSTLDSFTIVTCKANSAISKVHGRMPVIIGPEHYDTWLDARHNPRLLLQPFEGTPLRIAQVQWPASEDPSMARIAAAA